MLEKPDQTLTTYGKDHKINQFIASISKLEKEGEGELRPSWKKSETGHRLVSTHTRQTQMYPLTETERQSFGARFMK